MCGLFVITRFVMFGRFAMMLRCMFVVIRSVFVMLMDCMGAHAGAPKLIARSVNRAPRASQA
jgi:hypothetical protein